jgi:hypothetical protein
LPCALAVEREHLALDRANALLGDIAILRGEIASVVGDMREHRLQVGKIEQQQALIVGITEHYVEHAFLRLV